MRNRLITAMFVLLAICSSCRFDSTLERVPTPGLVGEREYSVPTDHPSEHVLRFDSKASEPEIRLSFETFCRQMGLEKSRAPSPLRDETWYESKSQGLGISVSPSLTDKSLLTVNIYRRF
jgi:hypothetical protein